MVVRVRDQHDTCRDFLTAKKRENSACARQASRIGVWRAHNVQETRVCRASAHITGKNTKKASTCAVQAMHVPVWDTPTLSTLKGQRTKEVVGGRNWEGGRKRKNRRSEEGSDGNQEGGSRREERWRRDEIGGK